MYAIGSLTKNAPTMAPFSFRTLQLLLWLFVAFLALLVVSPAQAFSGDYKPAPLNDLPIDAQKTYALVKSGGPFPYAKDGTTFGNREKRLPKQKRGYYKEYTVKTPGARNRGARRIVCGEKLDCFYTDDHYDSFKRIVE